MAYSMYAVVVCRPLYSTLRQNVHFVLLHDLQGDRKVVPAKMAANLCKSQHAANLTTVICKNGAIAAQQYMTFSLHNIPAAHN